MPAQLFPKRLTDLRRSLSGCYSLKRWVYVDHFLLVILDSRGHTRGMTRLNEGEERGSQIEELGPGLYVGAYYIEKLTGSP
jgi:hypothetical protein